MRMDLIQPFIGSLDAVLAEMMNAPARIVDLTMEEEGYRKKGTAATVAFRGEIEGRVILDMEPPVASQVASYLSDGEVNASETLLRETVAELANMVIGNAVTQLNDAGYEFKVFPPEILTVEQCEKAGQDTEATILCFETPAGNVHLNIAMQHHQHWSHESEPVPVQ
jgi:chemotaxis protein CheX